MTGQNQESSVALASLDADWVNFIMVARELGISKEIVKEFLSGRTVKTGDLPETTPLK